MLFNLRSICALGLLSILPVADSILYSQAPSATQPPAAVVGPDSDIEAIRAEAIRFGEAFNKRGRQGCCGVLDKGRRICG